MYPSRRPPRAETLILRNVRHHIWRWGPADVPPVLLLHGWADSGETFQFLVDCLPDDLAFAALDWRGFGRSEWAPAGYWFPDYLADLEACLDVLSPDRPARAVGHSMGANVLALFGGARPERFERMALLEGFGLPRLPPTAAPERYREWLDQMRGAAPQFASYGSFESFAGFLAKRNARLGMDRAQFIARAWGREHEGRIVLRADPRHKLLNPVLYRREEAEACWRSISAPALLLLGGRSEYLARLGPDGDPGTLAAHFQRAETVVLPDCGHMLHHEDPQGTAAALARFFTPRG
ncbi:MAG TPA: alpha/beta hydrolase [Steroidobacteraceae bacterium]|nr:alpha/beta hydrolase [Steroidobacteraceae bacterium]